MKIKINKAVLLSNIKVLNSLPNLVASSPIIQSLLIKVKNDYVEFINTNGLTSLKITIKEKINIIEEGEVLVKNKIFFSIIQKLNDEEILIEKIDNSVLKIKTNSFDSNLNILDSEQFPVINFSCKDWEMIEIKSLVIKEVYNKLSQSVSQNKEKISIFNGIYFDSNNSILNIVSSDTFKLSALAYKYNLKPFKLIVDQQLISILNDVLQFSDNIFFYYLENDLIIKLKNLLISTKIIEGDYPNVSQILNSPRTNKVVLSKQDLIGSLERGIVFSNSEKKPICKICFSKSNTEISFNSIELGNSIEKINNLDHKGNDLTVLINANFLLSLVKVFLSDRITIETSTDLKPIILTTDDEENFIQLVLPLRN